MSETVKELNGEDFKKTIAAGVTLIDFWAPWCGPCQMMGPVLESLAGSLGDTATVGKVNVDENSAAAGEYGVQSIPTLILFRGGEEVKRFVGVQSEEALSEAIKAALA